MEERARRLHNKGNNSNGPPLYIGIDRGDTRHSHSLWLHAVSCAEDRSGNLHRTTPLNAFFFSLSLSPINIQRRDFCSKEEKREKERIGGRITKPAYELHNPNIDLDYINEPGTELRIPIRLAKNVSTGLVFLVRIEFKKSLERGQGRRPAIVV